MDPPLHHLLLLSACLRHILSVSAQTPIALMNHTETANKTASLSTPEASTTVIPLLVTSQITLPARKETTATPVVSVTNAKSSATPPTTSIPGTYSPIETFTSVQEDRRKRTTPALTAAAQLSTVPGASSACPTGAVSTGVPVSPTQASGNSLTMLAFGVMSFILILIVIMVILVTAVNLRGRCNSSKEEGKKSGDSVVSESQVTSNGEKESITLVSVKTINTETDTDSPQISSAHSNTLDSEDHELRRDLLNTKLV